MGIVELEAQNDVVRFLDNTIVNFFTETWHFAGQTGRNVGAKKGSEIE